MGFVTNHFNEAGEKPEEIGLNWLEKLIFPPEEYALPAVETLPQPLQDAIHAAENLPPLEKLQVIHDAVLTYMTYQHEEGDSILRFEDVLKKGGKGDCDDYAVLESGLLRYAGCAEDGIELITSNAKYTSHSGVENAAHAVVVVTIDEEPILLDMNASTPLHINRENLLANGKTSNEGGQAGLPITVELNKPILIADFEGETTIYPDNVAAITGKPLKPPAP